MVQSRAVIWPKRIPFARPLHGHLEKPSESCYEFAECRPAMKPAVRPEPNVAAPAIVTGPIMAALQFPAAYSPGITAFEPVSACQCAFVISPPFVPTELAYTRAAKYGGDSSEPRHGFAALASP